jgi:hypothetical protein
MVSLYQLYFIALALVFQTVSLSNTRLRVQLDVFFGFRMRRLQSMGYRVQRVGLDDAMGDRVRVTG